MGLALVALVLGPVVLWRRRRDRLHKGLGIVWVLAMGGAAISALFIPSHFTPIGLGPIHLLSIYALWGIYVGLRAIYRRDLARHSATMHSLYVRGVVLAGAFNFLPERSIARSLIPETPWMGYAIIAASLIWAFAPLIKTALARESKKAPFQL